MVQYLSPHFEILVSSRKPIRNAQGLDFSEATLDVALAQEIVIPSMPSQFLEDFFTTHKKLLNPEALIVDVCSVKVKPVEILEKVLPKSCQILATHPLFGPTSAVHGLKNQKIMLYPARIPNERFQKIKQFLSGSLELQVIETTPEEHDRVLAYAQGLSHYIGRAMQLMDIPESDLTTKAYRDLLDMKRIQGSDSWELFESIMRENPYALEVNKKFKQTLKTLDEQIGIK